MVVSDVAEKEKISRGKTDSDREEMDDHVQIKDNGNIAESDGPGVEKENVKQDEVQVGSNRMATNTDLSELGEKKGAEKNNGNGAYYKTSAAALCPNGAVITEKNVGREEAVDAKKSTEQEGKDGAVEMGEDESTTDSKKSGTRVGADSPQLMDEKEDNSDADLEETKVEEKVSNEASRGEEKDEVNGDKDAPQAKITNTESGPNASLPSPATETGKEDAPLASSPTSMRRKRSRLPRMPPSVEVNPASLFLASSPTTMRMKRSRLFKMPPSVGVSPAEVTIVDGEDIDKESRGGNGDEGALQAKIPNTESGRTATRLSPATETDNRDRYMEHPPMMHKRRRGRPWRRDEHMMMPSYVGANPAMSHAAMMNPTHQMNGGMMMNPHMMYQPQMYHHHLMHRPAHVAHGQYMMAFPPGMMAANGGYPPVTMPAVTVGGSAQKAPANFVTLSLPVDGPSGMVLEDDATTGKPELKRLQDDSPIRHQIPIRLQSGHCIDCMKSERIGCVQPKSAKECVELVTKSKEGATTDTVTMGMLLVKTKEMALPKKAAGRGEGNKNWGKHFTALQKYNEQHGNCNVLPSRNLALAHWVLEQRRRKHTKTLGNKRSKRLDLIGFDWDGTSVVLPAATADSDVQGNIIKPAAPVYPPLAWDDAYEALVRFKDRCGLLPNSGDLHHWMEQQKKALDVRTNFSITQERAKKLLELGMDLSTELADKLKCAAGVNITDEVEKGNEGDEAEEEGSKSKRRKVCQDIPKETPSSSIFWKSAEAAKLFGYNRGDDILKGLQERVEVLKQANQSVDGWKSLVPDDGKEGTYSRHDILVVRHKAIYLIKGYLIAMKKMNNHNWGTCCKMASAELSPLGLTKFGGVAVASWNAHFRIDNKFPHPGRLTSSAERESNPHFRIFEYFPQAKEMFLVIANENKHQLSGRFMLEQFEEKILPTLERDSRDKGCFNDGTKPQKLLMRMLAKTPAEDSVVKWMHQLNIEWDPYATMRGRGSYLSQRMAEAWAAGKYANRRPKGQGLKKGQTQDPDIVEDDMQALDNVEINIADLM